MKVFEIDGQNVENELHEKVVEKLNNSGQGFTDTPCRSDNQIEMNGRPGNPDSGMRINLLVSRTQQPHFDNTRIVQIEKPVNGLGFNIVGGEVDHQGIISRIGKAFLSLTSCGWFQSFS